MLPLHSLSLSLSISFFLSMWKSPLSAGFLLLAIYVTVSGDQFRLSMLSKNSTTELPSRLLSVWLVWVLLLQALTLSLGWLSNLWSSWFYLPSARIQASTVWCLCSLEWSSKTCFLLMSQHGQLFIVICRWLDLVNCLSPPSNDRCGKPQIWEVCSSWVK